LFGDHWGLLACNIGARNRLIFEPDHHPRPEKPEGGLDWTQVTAIELITIEDYH
jgi:proteic killer suppression protein